MEQQMKSGYSDLEVILNQYGYSFYEVLVEIVNSKNPKTLSKFSDFAIRYTKNIPLWYLVWLKSPAIDGQLNELDMQAPKSKLNCRFITKETAMSSMLNMKIEAWTSNLSNAWDFLRSTLFFSKNFYL